MKAPVATSIRQGDHGPQARSNCKKTSPQHLQTGKHEYFLKAEIHGRSKPWESFTDDRTDLSILGIMVSFDPLCWSPVWATLLIQVPSCIGTLGAVHAAIVQNLNVW